jgi:hypothetical protein
MIELGRASAKPNQSKAKLPHTNHHGNGTTTSLLL